MNLRPKWQFYNITHIPVSNPLLITLLAASSYPSPIDTFSQNTFLFFLDKSSIEDVGSAPADNKNNTGSVFELSAQIESIG